MTEAIDFISNLPADPDEAFVQYEKYLRTEFLAQADDSDSSANEREYVLHIAAFSSVYGIDFGIELERMNSMGASDFWETFHELKAKVRLHAITMALSTNKRAKEGGSAIYVLSPAQKARIHNQLDEVRKIIAEANLSENKRDALTSRLNTFADEVDKDRTRGEALLSAYVWAKKELKDATDFSEGIEKILDVLSKAKEYLPSLPAPKVPKRLPAPKDTSSNDLDFSQDFDDEIPF